MQLNCPSCGCAYAADQADGLCPRCLAAMAVKPTDTPVDEVPIEPGETFHGLLVQKLVARGGMGIIYRARQRASNRDVALKILPRSLAVEEEFRLRFDREARALAGLSHPNIVNLYDYGIEGDLMFLVMEFVEGVSLRQTLRERKISPGRAVKVALDLCEALQFAHREGIIHRDIKPENVLMDCDGRVKLTDFGLAKRVDTDSTQLTQTHFAVGTPHYMAPEQLEQPKEIDHRVDIYSLGVLLYELLTGELPIGRFPAPSGKEGVDPRLDDIVYRCLEKDPDRRYQSVAELKDALAAAAGRSHESPPPGPADRPTPSRPRVASNVEVVCGCGWQFFVPAAARGVVHCPTCGEPVRLTAPTPVTRPTTPAPATTRRAVVESHIPAPRKVLIAVGGLTGLAVLLLVLLLGPGSSRREEDAVSTPSELFPTEDIATLPAKPPTKVSPLPSKPTLNAAEIRREIADLSSQSNMAGIVATVLLNSGRPTQFEQLQGRIRQVDDEIRDRIRRLDESGLRDQPFERYRSGDKITFFAGSQMTSSRSLAFADDLRTWLRGFRAGASEAMTVARGRQSITFTVQFPDRTPELVALADQAGIALGEMPPPPPPVRNEAPQPPPRPAGVPAIPAATLADVRQRLAALPLYYKNALPYDERGRAEALLHSGKGDAEEVLFLTGRFTDLLRRCEVEQKSFLDRTRELEARLGDPASAMDTVVCKDGRRIEGTLLEETETHVKVKLRLGIITYRREEIARLEKGKGPSADFRAAYDGARGRKTELLKLLAFAKEKKLEVQQELAAVAVLAIDPGDERCRAEIGLGRNPFAGAPDPEPIGDRVEYRGKLYTAEQLRQELKSIGYVQVNGLWCEKLQRTFKIDNLYRDEGKLPISYAGASIQAQTHSEKDTVYDYRTKSWVPRTKLVNIARYIGGSGSCWIEISAPGPILECRVRARSQVARAGGSVTVSAVLSPRETGGKVLYSLSAPGENDGSYDVTEKVAGSPRFYVRAETKGDAMFLISDSNDLGVFEVKCTYGLPLDRINALFATQMERGGEEAVRPATGDTIESICRTHAAACVNIPSLQDALAEMRRVTEGLQYGRDVAMPPRFADAAAQLKDPLLPDWNGMPREQSLRLGSWWGLLGQEDRRDFLSAYGLWCARSRYQRAPK